MRNNISESLLAACAISLAACANDAAGVTHNPEAAHEVAQGEAVGRSSHLPEFAVVGNGPLQLCERDRGDKVRDLFCSDPPPVITGLAGLQELLQAIPGDPPDGFGATPDGFSGMYPPNAFTTMLGHSTALSGHRVSPLNPRMIVITDGLFMAFQRGVQKVEVIARARNPGLFNFYLIEFEQACNHTQEGCSSGDLFTPRVEQAWLRVSIQDDEDLKNTPNDCRQCHQRASDSPRLLMRELNNPWTHFFQPLPASPEQNIGPGVQGHHLLQDYLAAKGDELYGGFSPTTVIGLAIFLLESTVFSDQPVLFDAPGIEGERFPYDPAHGYPQTPRDSPTWQAAYDAFKRGEQLALPYIEARVTDPVKHRQRTEAYQRYRAGELSEHELPDFADIFSDDPHVRAQLGLQTEPDASAEEALIQACGSCHNDILDQTLSRARFNIDLWKVDRSEISAAIDRIERAPSTPGVMPPPEARQLDPKARERLLEYLRGDPLASAPDTRLQQAAAMGMSGGKGRRARPTR